MKLKCFFGLHDWKAISVQPLMVCTLAAYKCSRCHKFEQRELPTRCVKLEDLQ